MLVRLTAIGVLFSGFATLLGVLIAYKVHKNQKLLSQRQLLLPLWEYISTLHKIDPNSPITPDVIKVVNTLELVALCCEGGMVDEQLIRRTFKDQYMKHYKSIKKCKEIQGLNIDELLSENKAAKQFYNKLNKEQQSIDKMKKA